MSSTTTVRVFWLTSITDGLDHAVIDIDMEAGCLAGQGEFLALCGRTVRVGSLFEASRPYCPHCLRSVARQLKAVKKPRAWSKRGASRP